MKKDGDRMRSSRTVALDYPQFCFLDSLGNATNMFKVGII